MKIGGEWAKRTSHKLYILSSRLIFFSINHIVNPIADFDVCNKKNNEYHH
jgi:hypothetical protein